ncbi:uncharacterized protein LOC108699297 [Xenopus laevis]|uniref:Uncharacterized protein LOC108699297 n=2 Tax=Xenopus laevis TaxID=8355 RepID=A0A1L8FBA0_XENLA|nr:uncharacterized protein LOC108699297 [Xenopus laevis]OCT68879.1 hypothetical protein XELAEV_18040187mg [Xenopus laevis]
MTKCIVKGCRHTTGQKLKFPHIVMHAFPSNLKMIKVWLKQTGQYGNNLEEMALKVLGGKKSDSYRLCSAHFTVDSYALRRSKNMLKKDAFPTLFGQNQINAANVSLTGPATQHPAVPLTTLQNVEDNRTETILQSPSSLSTSTNSPLIVTLQTNSQYVPNLPSFQETLMPAFVTFPSFKSVLCNNGLSSGYCFNSPVIAANTAPKLGMKDASTQTEILHKDESLQFPEIIEVKTHETIATSCNSINSQIFSMSGKDSHSTNVPWPLNLPYIKDLMEAKPDDVQMTFEEPFSKLDKAMESPSRNYSYHPGVENTAGFFDCPQLETYLSPIYERKFIVFESCLDELIPLLKCRYNGNCALPIKNIDKVVEGTCLTIYGTCMEEHKTELWKTQPKKQKLPLGNVLFSASVLCSGSNFLKVQDMCRVLGLQIISKKSHYCHQRRFVFPSIRQIWQDQQEDQRRSLLGPVSISVDGPWCKSGLSPKYCIWTVMEAKSKKVLSFNVEKGKPSLSHVALKKKTLRECLSDLKAKNLEIKSVCTDTNPDIKPILKEDCRNVEHRYSIFHICRSLKKKLLKASKKKNCADIGPWIEPIINHLCWSAKTCNGDKSVFKEKWKSLLYHVCNIHSWQSGNTYKKCSHNDVTLENCNLRMWLKRNSTAFRTLKFIVLDAKLQRHLQKSSEFGDVAELKDYHHKALKYRPEGVHFHLDGIIARTQLAALDHNFSTCLTKAIESVVEEGGVPIGTRRYRMHRTDGRNKWLRKNVCEKNATGFVFQILDNVINSIYRGH